MSVANAERVVWVVDDSPLDAERARTVLSRDHTVRVFSDGSAAIEALSSARRPHVLVLDWVMPGISGVEVCRFLRSSVLRTQDIAILLLTAQRHTEQIVEGLRAGANDFLAKPYADEELLARVGALLRSQEFLARAERAESENRRLLENTPDPLLVIDREGVLSFVNDAAAVALDKSSDFLVGLKLSEVLPDLASSMPLAASELAQAQADIAIHGRRFSPSVRFISDDGVTAILLRDVTERRVLEERRLDFYSIIAHDLRTPLQSIAQHLHMMKADMQLAATPSLSLGVQQIDANLQSLVTMINEFLELASVDSSAHHLERESVDIAKVLGTAADELRPLLEAKRHTWSIHASAAPEVRVLGDIRRLHQAMTNLIANAIKFTPDGGELSASIDATGPDANVQISVSDNGPGIDPIVAKTLFQRYLRADNSVAGSGLGLMIVREIVEAHGGKVGVESVPGRGARFWMRLPRKSAQPTAG